MTIVGGESQRIGLSFSWSYSVKAQCTGNRLAYLEPRGVHYSFSYYFWCLSLRAIAYFFKGKKQQIAKKLNCAHPSEPIRNSMQKPIGVGHYCSFFKPKTSLESLSG